VFFKNLKIPLSDITQMWAEVHISPYLTALLVSGDPDSAPWYFVTVRILRRPQNHSALSVNISQPVIRRKTERVNVLSLTYIAMLGRSAECSHTEAREADRKGCM